MNISFREDEQSVYFTISDYPAEYEPVLKGSYYTPEGQGFYKKFDKNIDHMDQIKLNFATYAEEMFAQQGYFRPVQWEKGLLAFIKKIEGKGIDWWLTGSCATRIRGISVEPHDIDIMLQSKDIEKIKKIFEHNIVEPIIDTKGWVVDYFGVLFMDARIDVAFDPQDWVDAEAKADFGPYAGNHLEAVVWQGYTIKVPPLKLQLEANRSRQRWDRVSAIEAFLLAGMNSSETEASK